MGDMDIEEHDLFENPILNEIFPDITVVKKEMFDFDEEIGDEKAYNSFKCSSNDVSNYSSNLDESKQDIKGGDLLLSHAKISLQDVGPTLWKSKKFCNCCLILFQDEKSLWDHRSLFHKHQNVCQFKTKKVIKTHKLNLEKSNSASLTKCVHCDLIFPSEQLLIEHLYDALNEQETTLHVASSENLTNSFYDVQGLFCCPVCSYYFGSKRIYTKHVLIKHNKKEPARKVRFNPNCKFCSLKFINVVSYNLHLRRKHRDKITQNRQTSITPKGEILSIEDTCKTSQLKQSINALSQISIKDIRISVLKNILFKCNECETHFLTSEAAASHGEHSKLLENWQCSICCRIFKQKDEMLHKEQHQYTTYFTISEITKESENLNNSNIMCLAPVTKNKEKYILNHHSSHHKEIEKKFHNMEYNAEETISLDCDMKGMMENASNSKFKPEMESNMETLVTYTCKNCNASMNTYTEVVDHCHLHSNLNDLGIDTIQCLTCKLNFVSSTFEGHQKLHNGYKTYDFKHFIFDVLNFGSYNDDWFHHLFGSLQKDDIELFLKHSIYKYENRIKMEISQQGPTNLTIYKCGECQCIIDSCLTYQHVENCNTTSVRLYCEFCNVPFVSKDTKRAHEIFHQEHSNMKLEPFRIVTFNRNQDEVINKRISTMKKYYVFHQCRGCHVVVDRSSYDKHQCHSINAKLCAECGLLIQESQFILHTTKHSRVDSFNKEFIHVVLIGNSIISSNRYNLLSKFNGMISDYTFYKCVNCEIFIRDVRDTKQHRCNIDSALSKCPICDLIFNKRKFKGHMKLHDIDPDFTKDTLLIQEFNTKIVNNKIKVFFTPDVNTEENKIFKYDEVNVINVINKKVNDFPSDKVKIYKCSCGLHFFDEMSINSHKSKCSGKMKIKQSKQNCLKCGLTFSPDILFQHLLKHHKGKNAIFRYELI